MSITSTAPRNFHFDPPSTPETVGPGNYNHRGCFSPPKKSRIPFGTTTRRDLWNIPDGYEQVGPGAYDPKAVLRSPSCMANFQLESKRIYWEDNKMNVSPADHSPIKKWGKNRPKTGLNNRPKLKSIFPPPIPPKPELPGPGAYNLINDEVENKNACPFFISKSPQREPARYNGIPGPGAYGELSNLSNRLPSPAFKSREKRKIFNNPINDCTMREHFAWMPEVFEGRPFGANAARELDWQTPGKESPGPDVHADLKPKKFEKQHHPFGSDRITYPESYAKNPGPGFYEKDDKPYVKSKLPSFTKAERPELWGIKITPSPGQYEPNIDERIENCVKIRTASPAFKDRSERYGFMVDKQPNPGPGGYYANKPGKKHYSKLPRDARFREDNFCGPDKMNDAPSPANYTVETEATRKRIPGGAKINGGRFDKGPKNTKVGPGRYGVVECDMMKQSYNVMFDPEFKRKSEMKKLY
ncbi:hypothetical protein TRFO_28627 [Tritrichomonas foetus]|uniref:Uncharacterized protein n=1 Tax=Tritrichomonas foetus TaxID=1144522 RepID=A0A1J4JYA3_9EUKA|nr:hypothetical protein TRFO_28627 [Tritrichomonas foetus]|eukprot:OHT03971.1 hypothetical protein TRFO_28627 [Tritrichomonas foetus]